MIHRKTRDGKRIYDIEEFTSITEFVTTINNRDYNPSYRYEATRERVKDNPSWYGAESFEKAQDMLFHGWNERTAEVIKFTEKAKTQDIRKMISFRNDIVGFAPIVPLAIMGVPQNMINAERRVIKTKIVDLIYDMGAICTVDMEDMLEQGMKIAKLIISLENSGYRVNLRGMICFYSHNSSIDSQIALIRLKDANQPIDINKLMFPLFHTAMFRCIGFDYLERKPNIPYLSGYGSQIGVMLTTSEARELIRKVVDSKAIYLSYYSLSKVDTDEELKQEVTNENKLKG